MIAFSTGGHRAMSSLLQLLLFPNSYLLDIFFISHVSCFMSHFSRKKVYLLHFLTSLPPKARRFFFPIGGNSDFFYSCKIIFPVSFGRGGGLGFIPAWEFFFSSSIRSLEMKWPSWPHTAIMSIISSASSGTQQKPNSGTYNFVEVSGHNLESSQTWDFCIVFYQVFLLFPLQCAVTDL